MSTYLVIKNGAETKSYTCTTSAEKPYIKINTDFLPLTTETKTGLNLKVKVDGSVYVPREKKETVTLTGYRYIEMVSSDTSSFNTANISTKKITYNYNNSTRGNNFTQKRATYSGGKISYITVTINTSKWSGRAHNNCYVSGYESSSLTNFYYKFNTTCTILTSTITARLSKNSITTSNATTKTTSITGIMTGSNYYRLFSSYTSSSNTMYKSGDTSSNTSYNQGTYMYTTIDGQKDVLPYVPASICNNGSYEGIILKEPETYTTSYYYKTDPYPYSRTYYSAGTTFTSGYYYAEYNVLEYGVASLHKCTLQIFTSSTSNESYNEYFSYTTEQ